jgi:hypothetical protein
VSAAALIRAAINLIASASASAELGSMLAHTDRISSMACPNQSVCPIGFGAMNLPRFA